MTPFLKAFCEGTLLCVILGALTAVLPPLAALASLAYYVLVAYIAWKKRND